MGVGTLVYKSGVLRNYRNKENVVSKNTNCCLFQIRYFNPVKCTPSCCVIASETAHLDSIHSA